MENLKQFGVVREVRGKGILLGVELVKDTHTPEPFPELGMQLKKTVLKSGIILRINPCWFAVSPALIATEAQLDEMCRLIEKSLAEALEQVCEPSLGKGTGNLGRSRMISLARQTINNARNRQKCNGFNAGAASSGEVVMETNQ